MRVLVACEFSGIVRDAFIARGHDAVSCDLLDTERPGPHYKGDVRDMLSGTWDLVIAHPPCTYLCNSGVRWLGSNPGRWLAMEDAAQFFNLFKGAAPRVCIENPVPHKYARVRIGGYSQIIQPWQFGHGEIKATCLWLENLPSLVPAKIVDGRVPRVHHASPGPERWKERSRTYPGVADAMAGQWGSLACSS